jgi:hypothetical protein
MKLREDRVFWQKVQDEIIILDLDRSTYSRLNGSGTFLWELLRESFSEDDMVDALMRRYDVDGARAQEDVRAFVETLKANGLLET